MSDLERIPVTESLDWVTRLAANDMIIDVAVSWNLRWMNPPRLHFLIRDDGERYGLPAPFSDDRVYHPFPSKNGGTYWVHHRTPLTTFLLEDRRPAGTTGGANPDAHGAAGRKLIRPDGTEYVTYGGWSSNAGAINRLRMEHVAVLEVLPDEIVEVTYHKATWDALGIAGCAWDVGFVKEQLARYCPGVVLVTHNVPADDRASDEQSLAAMAGISGVPRGSTWIPMPGDTDEAKPSEDSSLYAATSIELKYAAARALRANPEGGDDEGA